MRQLTVHQILNARLGGHEREAIAWAAGEDIEYACGDEWFPTANPKFYQQDKYRVRPKPVMVKVNRDGILKRLAMIPADYGQTEINYVRTMLEAAEVVE